MTSRLSAAYKGVHALLMQKGAQDFRSGQPFNQASYFDSIRRPARASLCR